MNQNQRKYATERIREITNLKIFELNQSFDTRPENKLKPLPNQLTYTNQEILRALLGFESPAVFIPKEEWEEKIIRMGNSVYLQLLVQCTNQGDINAINAYNEEIRVRRKRDVSDKISLIQAQSRRTQDIVMLGDNDIALEAIRSFENFQVNNN